VVWGTDTSKDKCSVCGGVCSIQPHGAGTQAWILQGCAWLLGEPVACGAWHCLACFDVDSELLRGEGVSTGHVYMGSEDLLIFKSKVLEGSLVF
jgi:hypothetical protein